MEYMDIVNKEDNVIGKASKEDIYKKQYTNRIAHIFIFDKKGKMTLQLRTKNVFYPNHRSTSVRGHVQTGESYEDATLREYEEELGVKSKLEFLGKDFYQAESVPDKFLTTFKTIHDGPFKIYKRAIEKVEFLRLMKSER